MPFVYVYYHFNYTIEGISAPVPRLFPPGPLLAEVRALYPGVRAISLLSHAVDI